MSVNLMRAEHCGCRFYESWALWICVLWVLSFGDAKFMIAELSIANVKFYHSWALQMWLRCLPWCFTSSSFPRLKKKHWYFWNSRFEYIIVSSWNSVLDSMCYSKKSIKIEQLREGDWKSHFGLLLFIILKVGEILICSQWKCHLIDRKPLSWH